MNEIIFNTTLIRGAKGATGQGTSYEVPTGTIIAYDGTDTPEGYVDTQAPEGMGGDYSGFLMRCATSGDAGVNYNPTFTPVVYPNI